MSSKDSLIPQPNELEGYIEPLGKQEFFRFRCHPGVVCFNECCRQLELALTPYDVIRLRASLKISSQEFMEQHALIEWTENHQYPLVYLGMVDDGRASCPFVRPEGCLVYANRPGACRTYPVGRGAAMAKNKEVQIKYLLIHEGHCRGFENEQSQNIAQWEEDQEIQTYNHFNDRSMLLTQHPKLRRGMRLSDEQKDLYIEALYHPDSFRKHPLFLEELSGSGRAPENIPEDEVLEMAIQILIRTFFQ